VWIFTSTPLYAYIGSAFLLLWWGETMSLGTGSLTAPLSIPQMIHEWIWSSGEMILTGENRRTRRKTCPSATLSTINPTWTDLWANSGLHGDWWWLDTSITTFFTRAVRIRIRIVTVFLCPKRLYPAQMWQARACRGGIWYLDKLPDMIQARQFIDTLW
jgi:hypothetical protein